MGSNPLNTEVKFTNGERIDLKNLFQSHYPELVSFAFKYVDDTAICEDLVQDVFVSFWEKQKTFPNLITVKSFFYTSVRNSCINHLRHDKVKAKYRDYKIVREEPSESFLEEVIRKEAYHEIYHEINKLPEMGRKVLLLSLREKTNEEIAQILEITINTVKTHKARAYKVLRQSLNDLILFFLSLRSASAKKNNNWH